MKVIGIIGSRCRCSRRDFGAVAAKFWEVYEPGDWICSGGCSRGADAWARELSRKHGIPYLEFPADWRTHGTTAGFIRNGEIAKHSDILIACPQQGRASGTSDTVEKWRQQHPNCKPVLV